MTKKKNSSPFDKASDLVKTRKSKYARKINYSLEIFPPRDETRMVEQWEAVDAFCKLNPSCISITCGAFGRSSENNKNIALQIKGLGAYPVPHLTCLGKSADEMRTLAENYKELGLTSVLALRGDYPANSSPKIVENAKRDKHSLTYAIQLVSILVDVGGFDITVAAYAEKHPEAKSLDDDINKLKDKLDAGAKRAITQFFFDPDTFFRFRDRAAAAGISAPIIPGVLPILNINKAMSFAKKCQVEVPDFLLRMYKDVAPSSIDHKLLAMNILSHQITRMITEGVDFFHFYTLNDVMLSSHICHWLKEGF